MNNAAPETTTLLNILSDNELGWKEVVTIINTDKLTSAEDYSDYVDPMFPTWLLILLFLIGVTGNLISLLCFYRMNNQKALNSTYIYLAIICVVDVSALFFGLGDVILIYSDIIIRGKSLFNCRLFTFLLYTSTHFSSFLLAAVSIDRAIAVTFFNYAKKYCRPHVAYKVIGACYALAVTINFHTLLFLGYDSYGTNETNIYQNTSANSSVAKFVCTSQPDSAYDHFLYPYFDWIDLLSYTIIPFIVMGICTVMIVKVLCDSKERLKRMNAGSSTRRNSVEETQLMVVSAGDGTKSKQELIKRKRPNTKKINKSMQLTYTLISINIVFFLLLSPLTIIRIIDNNKIKVNRSVVMVFYLLAYGNHCFNFIFYGLSSEIYRKTLFEILCIDRFFKRYTPRLTEES